MLKLVVFLGLVGMGWGQDGTCAEKLEVYQACVEAIPAVTPEAQQCYTNNNPAVAKACQAAALKVAAIGELVTCAGTKGVTVTAEFLEAVLTQGGQRGHYGGHHRGHRGGHRGGRRGGYHRRGKRGAGRHLAGVCPTVTAQQLAAVCLSNLAPDTSKADKVGCETEEAAATATLCECGAAVSAQTQTTTNAALNACENTPNSSSEEDVSALFDKFCGIGRIGGGHGRRHGSRRRGGGRREYGGRRSYGGGRSGRRYGGGRRH